MSQYKLLYNWEQHPNNYLSFAFNGSNYFETNYLSTLYFYFIFSIVFILLFIYYYCFKSNNIKINYHKIHPKFSIEEM